MTTRGLPRRISRLLHSRFTPKFAFVGKNLDHIGMMPDLGEGMRLRWSGDGRTGGGASRNLGNSVVT
ncbi:hypothetical protein FAIPA1_210018 [Frankia sp. AiPs1]|uniref:hypothetical protein n=1 Tax=Frankia sp. AiPa1 TaxID=573492 RepID=UPI00202B1DBA|nr:hypothetical protein [Frankia sp. AiPa1]MCL9758619.1 hypothetical protein [Frankia sp. AiPa1]